MSESNVSATPVEKEIIEAVKLLGQKELHWKDLPLPFSIKLVGGGYIQGGSPVSLTLRNRWQFLKMVLHLGKERSITFSDLSYVTINNFSIQS